MRSAELTRLRRMAQRGPREMRQAQAAQAMLMRRSSGPRSAGDVPNRDLRRQRRAGRRSPPAGRAGCRSRRSARPPPEADRRSIEESHEQAHIPLGCRRRRPARPAWPARAVAAGARTPPRRHRPPPPPWPRPPRPPAHDRSRQPDHDRPQGDRGHHPAPVHPGRPRAASARRSSATATVRRPRLRVDFSEDDVFGLGDQSRAASWSAVTVATLLSGAPLEGRYQFQISGPDRRPERRRTEDRRRPVAAAGRPARRHASR